MASSGESSDEDGDYSTVVELGTRSASSGGNGNRPARPNLDPSTVPQDPFMLFLNWLGQNHVNSLSRNTHDDRARDSYAFSAPQPTCVLSTVEVMSDQRIRPRSRTISLKAIGSSGHHRPLIFYTNLTSPKAAQLRANPSCSLVFQPPPDRGGLGRQIILDCLATELSHDSRAIHWSNLSGSVKLREYRSPRMSSLITTEQLQQDASFDGPIPTEVPEFWGGFGLSIQRFEFWEGMSTPELHGVDRVVFEKMEGEQGWKVGRLAP